MNYPVKIKYILLAIIIILIVFLFFSTPNTNSKNLKLTASINNHAQFALDKNSVYWLTLEDLQLKPDTFKIFKGKLKPSIYSTPETEYIMYTYATDGKNLYYMNNVLPTADVVDINSFEPIENGEYMHFYGKDRNNVYYKNYVIVGANPVTFEILWRAQPEGCMPSNYSKDDKHVFYESKLVEGADIKTFQILTEGYGKDNNHVYLKDKVQQGLNPSNFKAPVCEYGV
jgi:hypothetical protein